MRIATTIMLTDESIRPARLAQEVEQRGFDGLYLPEHTHIPVSRETPAPMGEPLPRAYGRIVDPMVALAAAATVTERITLGTSVALVAQHDPVVLAKQVATLDMLSDGRLTLGVGFGWNREEAADHGVDWPRRRGMVRDHIALMRSLWAAEPADYHGEFASVRASWAYPKPVRPGGPRILLGGGAGPELFRHIAEYADGWLPVGGSGLSRAVQRLRDAWDGAGRGPEGPVVVPAFVVPSAGKMGHYRELGVEEVVLQLPSGGEKAALRALDDYSQYL